MKVPGGVIPPVVTLFDKNGKIDWEANYRHQEFLIEKGVDGIAYLGTTGEFGALTMAEKKELMEKMTEHAAGRVRIVAGVSDTCLANVLDLVKCCEKTGVDGLLLLPPYYSVYPAEMTEAFFGAVAESTKLPIILYNFPAQTGFEITRPWVENIIRKYHNIAGIKETVPNVEHLRDMMKAKQTRPDFKVFAAYDDQFLEAKRLGADGFIHAAANYAPEAGAALWRSRDQDEWEKLFARVIAAMAVYNVASPLYLGVKEAVCQREKFENTSERLPAMPLAEEQKKAVRRILSEERLLDA